MRSALYMVVTGSAGVLVWVSLSHAGMIDFEGLAEGQVIDPSPEGSR